MQDSLNRIGIARRVLVISGLVIAALLIWFFIKIVLYIFIAAILSFISEPLLRRLNKVHLGTMRIPKVLSTALTMIIVYGIIFSIIAVLIPILYNELNSIANIDKALAEERLNQILGFIDAYATKYNIGTTSAHIKDSILSYIEKTFNFGNISTLLTDVFSFTATFLAGLFAVSFIYFFFLKDEKMFERIVLSSVPEKQEGNVKEILTDTQKMLGKYIRGVVIDMIIVGILVTFGLYIIGVKNSFIIGIAAGVLNIIPYVGPIIAMAFGLLLGITSGINEIPVNELNSFSIKIISVFLIIQLLDGLIFQPYIFSKSVQAHPLEIFIVILMANTLGGIVGMIAALPTYIVLRIVALQFFSNYKIVKKLTQNIEQ